MDTFRDRIAALITNGASMHRVAERLILEIKPLTTAYKAIATAKLSFIYRMPFDLALAVVEEMDA
jgi:hypothetical protein